MDSSDSTEVIHQHFAALSQDKELKRSRPTVDFVELNSKFDKLNDTRLSLHLPVVQFDPIPLIQEIPHKDGPDPEESGFSLPFLRSKYREVQKPILKVKAVMGSTGSIYDSLLSRGTTDNITKHNTIANTSAFPRLSASAVIPTKSSSMFSHVSSSKSIPIPPASSSSILFSDLFDPKPPEDKNSMFFVSGELPIGNESIIDNTTNKKSSRRVTVKFSGSLASTPSIESILASRSIIASSESNPPSSKPSKTTRKGREIIEEAKQLTSPDPRPKLTVSMIKDNGKSKLTVKSTYLENAPPLIINSIALPPKTDFRNFFKIDFQTVDLMKMQEYCLALASEEKQFKIPIIKHKKKMEDFEFKADQELFNIMQKITPKEKKRREIGDPVYLRGYSSRKANPYFDASRLDLLPPRTKHRPSIEILHKVDDWFRRNALTKPKSVVWIQPVLQRIERDMEGTIYCRKRFNLIDGRVQYPYHNPKAVNSFSMKYDRTLASTRELMAAKYGPDKKFLITFPLAGYDNSEITFDLQPQTNIVFVIAKTNDTKKIQKHSEECFEIPDRLTITDLEFARDRQGNLVIEELPDAEKRRVREISHKAVEATRSLTHVLPPIAL